MNGIIYGIIYEFQTFHGREMNCKNKPSAISTREMNWEMNCKNKPSAILVQEKWTEKWTVRTNLLQ